MSYFFGFNTPEEQKKIRKAALTAIGEKVTSFFWDIAPNNGFEMREGQQDMSFEIVDALIRDQHFAVEAGVGIGKSFGYLVPALLYNKKMEKPVMDILVREYRCSGGTDTANPAAGNRCSGTEIPHLIDCYLRVHSLKAGSNPYTSRIDR